MLTEWLPTGKAPGDNDVEMAWFKAACDVANPETEQFPSAPQTALGEIVFQICNRIWRSAEIPSSMMTALLVSLHKKGDRTDPSNYRGIALMDSLLKLITRTVSSRLLRALEVKESFVPFQAGFRRTGECVAHYASLLEICQRRRAVGQDTYICFLDFSKAFDCVPFEILMFKLANIGVHGRCFDFFKSLYSCPTARVRNHYSGQHGEAINVTRGVRQGCPSSPLLFNIFINDIFATFTKSMCTTIPGVDTINVPGLLFADDTALLSGSVDMLKYNLTRLADWAAVNFMSFNVSKCGVMHVSVNSTSPSNFQNVSLTLHGSEVPIVDEYMYLGLPFHRSLELTHVVEARVERLKTVAGAIRSFCRNSSIPLCAKLPLLRSVLRSVATYGGEIIGMNKALTQPVAALYNKCFPAICAGWGTPAAAVVMRELCIPSVYAITSSMRVRLSRKYINNFRHLLGHLVSSVPRPIISSSVAGSSVRSTPKKSSLPPRNVNAPIIGSAAPARRTPVVSTQQRFSATWSVMTRTWISRYLEDDIAEQVSSSTPQVAASTVRKVLIQKDWSAACCASVGARFYEEAGFVETRGFVRAYNNLRCYSLDSGLAGLIACRTGGIRLARHAALAQLIHASYANCCPCCKVPVRESLAHLFLDCSAWKTQRAAHLKVVISKIRNAVTGLRGSEVVTLLLGGRTRNFTLGAAWLSGSASRPAYYLNVVRFLAAIKSQRNKFFFVARNTPAPAPAAPAPAPAVAPASPVPAAVPAASPSSLGPIVGMAALVSGPLAV